MGRDPGNVFQNNAMMQTNKNASMYAGGTSGSKSAMQVQDEKNATMYSNVFSNYSGQRAGRMHHVVESDDYEKQLASRLIGKTRVNNVGKDILREYY